MNKDLLPQSFVREMEALLGSELADYLNCLDQEWKPGLRVNTLKISPEEFQTSIFPGLDPVPWVEGGFYYQGDEMRPSRHPAYFAGLYYLQEPSAMTPGAFLPVTPGDRVLDTCAAPGGKSTQLAAALQGTGLLVSNDLSHSRAKALLKNLEMAGVANGLTTAEDPQNLAQVWPEFFDKILVDAPCSGEGMFRRSPDMVRDWEKRGPAAYAPVQREVLKAAARMLRPGGMILYSTCTFSRLEDEETIQEVLDEFPEFEIAPLDGSRIPGAVDSPWLPGCLRLYPHRVRGEGHFLGMIRRKGESTRDRQPVKAKMQGVNLPEFLSRIQGMDLCRKRIFQKGDCLYLLPEDGGNLPNLRYLRTGLLLGEMKKGRFEPSQALAMALKQQDYQGAVLNLSMEDERAVRYLKGETLLLEPGETVEGDWILVCAGGWPLGWAKKAGSVIKNKYAPGWRWQ